MRKGTALLTRAFHHWDQEEEEKKDCAYISKDIIKYLFSLCNKL